MLEAERKWFGLFEKGSAVGLYRLKLQFQLEQGRFLLPVQLRVVLSRAVCEQWWPLGHCRHGVELFWRCCAC